MKFILSRTLQNKPIHPEITLEVTPKRRNGYQSDCGCRWVYAVDPSAHDELVERRLLLREQASKQWVTCGCMGSLAPASVEELLDGKELPTDIIQARSNFISKWHRDETGSFIDDLDNLLVAHAECMTELVPRPAPGKLKLSRPLAVIDLETTDPEAATCAIFEFAVTVIMPDGSRKQWSKTFKPWKPISPGAQEVTGKKNADVENCPPFSQFAAQILKGLEGKDLAGYNIKQFDAVVLDQEARRCGMKLSTEGVTFIDAFHIYQRKDPRDLSAAVRKYCGREHEGAHGALSDCSATADVLEGLIGAHPDLTEMSVAELDRFSMRDPGRNMADLPGNLYRDADGDLRYTLKKVRDMRVGDEVGFAYWMLKQDFPESTKEVLRAELDRLGL